MSASVGVAAPYPATTKPNTAGGRRQRLTPRRETVDHFQGVTGGTLSVAFEPRKIMSGLG
jgi:hypothetical protein